MKVKLLTKTQNMLDVVYTGARTCYNAGSPIDLFEDVEDISEEKKLKLIKSCIESGHHCYDKDTEVLTEKGFKKWHEITYQDKLGVFDVENGCLVGFEIPKKLICDDYDGIMYYLDTNKINMMITPNHRIYCSLSNTVQNRLNPKFKIYKTEHILDNKKVINKPMRFKSYSNTLLQGEYNPLFLNENKLIYFYKLFGFFIGDGYSNGGNILQFHIKKERKIQYLKDLCNNLGFELKIRANNKFNVIYKDLGNFARNNWYKDGEKYIPEIILKCSKSVIENILDGLINSDGSISTKSLSIRYDTTSFEVANMVQSMFLLTGYSATMLEKKKKNPKHSSCYLVQRFNDASMPHINDSRNKKSYIQEIKYKGKIYCAEVSTGLLMVKRGEKRLPYLSGNSVLEHTQFTFAIEGVSRSLLAQICRHRIGVSLSVQSQRYVNLEDTFDYVTPNSLQDEGDSQKCFTDAMSQCHENYKELINKGIAPEDSRAVLPNACCTNMVITTNLRSFINLCHLRLCSHSQLEIRQLVKEMVKEVIKVEPWLKPYLVPKCEFLNFCNEKHRPCGRKPTLEDLKQKWYDAGYEGGYNDAKNKG